MTFARDLSQKYTRYFSDNVDRPDLDRDNLWQVAGYYDFLQVNRFNSLKQLEEVGEGEREVSWLAFSDLVVIPFADHEPDNDFVAKVCDPGAHPGEANPLLLVSKITLAPAVFEFDDDPDKVMEAIHNAARHLRGSLRGPAKKFATHCFASLSGPDIVVLSLPRTATQLWDTQRVVRRARTLMLAEIEQGKSSHDLNHTQARLWPGHACVAVEPVLALRTAALPHFSKKRFRKAEEKAGLRLAFRLRLDCGHEDQVMQDITQNCPRAVFLPLPDDVGVAERATSWGNYSVGGYFSHLSDFVTVLQDLWASTTHSWREQHLIDSITAVSFRDRHADDDPPLPVQTDRAWTLTEEVQTGLDEIREKLWDFSEDFLSRSQRAELRGIYLSFRGCFFRYELLGTARDLYPFFKQLSNALGLQDYWTQYLKRPASEEESDPYEAVGNWIDFNKHVRHLLSHANRAVRNRVEHRALEGDPPVPHTLSHGACKLINAYSVVFWLAAELFRRAPGETTQVPGDALCFAASVCVGSSGHVECDELFVEYRKFVERAARSGCQLPASRRLGLLAPEGWSARLLLLDISGSSLLRPELCFVHCLHEMAELSEWILLDRCESIRRILNEWILKEVVLAFNYSLAVSVPQAADSSPAQPLQSRILALRPFALHFVRNCALAHVLGQPAPVDKDSIARLLESCYVRRHPVEFVSELVEALENGASDGQILDSVAQILDPQGMPPSADRAAEAARSHEFSAAVEPVREIATETLADIGMWCALDHIIGTGKPRNQEARLEDLHRIFESLLIAAAESSGSKRARSRLDQTIVHRWAIQAAALMSGRLWGEAIGARIKNLSKRCPGAVSAPEADRYLQYARECKIQFEGNQSLVAKLSTLVPYGGSEPGPAFPSESTFTPAERDLFDAFRSTWSSSSEPDRIRFVFKLWATSGKFGVKRILERAPEGGHQLPSSSEAP